MQKVHLINREDWRKWLKENHKDKKDVWLVFNKKHTGKPRIPYDDAVEEALCFGWIDTTVRKIDEEKYMQRFTPRKTKSPWSKLNKDRVNKLIKEGQMAEAGMEMVNTAKQNGEWEKEAGSAKKEMPEMPPELKQALSENQQTWDNFMQLAPSYRKEYLVWVTSAKREATKEKRIKETVALVAQNKRLSMK